MEGQTWPVEVGRLGVAVGPQAQCVVAGLQIGDPATFEHRYPVVALRGFRHQRQKLGTEIMAKQYAWQKLPVVQGLLGHAVAGQKTGGLLAQPFEIGTG